MNDSLYKGIATPTIDPARGLLDASEARDKSIGRVVAGIEAMQKNQAERMILANTLAAQNELKNRIKQQGLSLMSEPIDFATDPLVQRFGTNGSMVDRAALEKTYGTQTDLLKNNILSAASGKGQVAFAPAASLPTGADAHYNELLANGAQPAWAREKTNEWMTSMKPMVENDNLIKNESLVKSKSKLFDVLRTNDAMPINEALNYSLQDVKDHHKEALRGELKTTVEQKGSTNKEQQEHLASIDAHVDARNKIAASEILKTVSPFKVAVDNARGVPQSMVEYAAALNKSTVGGIGDAITKDATNTGTARVTRAIMDWGKNVSASDAANAVNNNVLRVLSENKTMTHDQALAIGLQAYQLAKIEQSAGSAGVSINTDTLAKHVNTLVSEEPGRIAANAAYVKAQNEADLKIAKLTDDTFSTKQKYRDEIRKSNITERNYNALAAYQKDPANAYYTNPPVVDPNKPKTPEEIKAEMKAEVGNKVNNEVTINGFSKSGSQANPMGSPAPLTKPAQAAPVVSAETNLKKAATTGDPVEDTIGDIVTRDGLLTKAYKGLKKHGSLQGWVDNAHGYEATKNKLSGIPTAAASVNPDPIKEATDVRRGIIAGYDIKSYTPDAGHEENVLRIHNRIPEIKTASDVDSYIKKTHPKSPLTGEMITNASKTYDVSPKILLSIMEADSSLGTKGKGVRTKNPGNVGNWPGNERYYKTPQDGVNAVAHWLSKHKAKKDK